MKEAAVKCPRCASSKKTRKVPTETGYDKKLIKYVCDACEIGWYEYPGKRTEKLIGGLEPAKQAYRRTGRV